MGSTHLDKCGQGGRGGKKFERHLWTAENEPECFFKTKWKLVSLKITNKKKYS